MCVQTSELGAEEAEQLVGDLREAVGVATESEIGQTLENLNVIVAVLETVERFPQAINEEVCSIFGRKVCT